MKDGVEVQKIIRWGRRYPAELRDALRVRDGFCCTTPGCSTTTGLQIDHIEPVARGGADTYANLHLLCHHHHTRKNETDRLFDPEAGRDPPDTS